MNIILIRNNQANKANIQLTKPVILLSVFLLLVAVPAAVLFVGFQWGQQHGEMPPEALQANWEAEAAKYQQELEKTKQEAQHSLNALAMRLGQLQGHVIRLDAMGGRLTDIAGLDKGEFNFQNSPAQGGPSTQELLPQIGVTDFIASLENLEKQLEDREQQIGVLSSMIMNRNLYDEVLPAGRPIKKGWMSSYFGMRTDPFTGRQERHKGVDFAGKEGSNVIAVAAGVVTWADKRYGYGNLVEINHGNGYVTRYGHNNEILVKEGQAIKKNDTIALMGSTGRSTGPHVHFEVLRNGKPVDPVKYIRASR